MRFFLNIIGMFFWEVGVPWVNVVFPEVFRVLVLIVVHAVHGKHFIGKDKSFHLEGL
jgi:hypothetical protein